MKVLLSGHIDLNVLDGSALFMANLAMLASSHESVEVDLLSTKPVSNLKAIREIIAVPGINIVDPYSRGGNREHKREEKARWGASRSESAELIAEQALEGYDVVFVRDTLVAWEAAERLGLPARNLAVYVTGFTHFDQQLDPELCAALLGLMEAGALLVFQTEEMRDWVSEHVVGRDIERSFVLMPSVPLLFSAPRGRRRPQTQGQDSPRKPLRLVYVGKFFPAWCPIEQIVAFREFRRMSKDAEMVVAGDHFPRQVEDPLFADNVRYLLSETEGLRWTGGVSREQAFAIMRDADIGISMRGKELESSLELSSKVLEYGACGLGVVLNRTAMHERLLGADYPLFASTIAEATECFARAASEPAILAEAAERCASLAAERSFQNGALEVSDLLMTVLNPPGFKDLLRDGGLYSDPAAPEMVRALDLLDKRAVRMVLASPELSFAGDLDRPVLLLKIPVSKVFGLEKNAESAAKQELLLSESAWRIARESIAASSGQDGSHFHDSATDRQGAGDAGNEMASGASARIAELQGTVAFLEKRGRHQAQELIDLDKKLKSVNQSLSALRSSKLGSVQVAWWRFRGARKRATRRPDDEALNRDM